MYLSSSIARPLLFVFFCMIPYHRNTHWMHYASPRSFDRRETGTKTGTGFFKLHFCTLKMSWSSTKLALNQRDVFSFRADFSSFILLPHPHPWLLRDLHCTPCVALSPLYDLATDLSFHAMSRTQSGFLGLTLVHVFNSNRLAFPDLL